MSLHLPPVEDYLLDRQLLTGTAPEEYERPLGDLAYREQPAPRERREHRAIHLNKKTPAPQQRPGVTTTHGGTHEQ